MSEVMRPKSEEGIIKEAIENKEENIIIDAEEARRRFRDFWKTNKSPEDAKNEIKQLEEQEYNDFIQQGDEQLAWFLQDQRAVSRKRRKSYNPDELIFVSGSKEKRNELSEILKERGIILSDSEEGDEEELSEHKKIKEYISEDTKKEDRDKRGYEPYWYSLDIAKSKVAHTYDKFENNPIITSDIVVLKGEGLEADDILEKAENEEDALNILERLSGEYANVSCGITLLTETKSAKKILLKGGINFRIKLRNFSTKEAKDYIKQKKNSVLNVAGVIDYSSDEAKKFIDNGVAVKVGALKLDGHSKDSVLISAEILPQLKDYFKGVPRELIEEILNKQKVLNDA